MWDAFISHASEDKENLVRPLAKYLSDVYKVNIWYDEFTLEYGDSLLQSIEKGMQDSVYGIIILSKAFFNKKWTNHEYESLKTKEMLLNEKVLIPIWFNVSREEVADYYLNLANKYAITINGEFDIDDIATKLIKVIRPDIYNNISRMHYVEQHINKGLKAEISDSDMKKIQAPLIRHEKLSIPMKARLKLIYNSIKDVDIRTFERYEEEFRMNTNLDREMVITELITAAYLDCINTREMTLEEKAFVYSFTLTLANPNNNLPICEKEKKLFTRIVKDYLQDINADIVVEFKFE